ncbi:hypothetical protein [Candidatus Reidiella endopervernicosa]|uniref:Uncharacterized protein n=1 Tax=Candidatus Reidiella endopervernicosa TaxID=2738883 RepID=A0A6N0HSJ4_9GAMM|nr:hypothetical protein [Candidatus Reidiella endopervernicosa]QKQ25200.1 hypothetical protein HUE57_02005 [Candidatus Reidiella endopervernicosa]
MSDAERERRFIESDIITRDMAASINSLIENASANINLFAGSALFAVMH